MNFTPAAPPTTVCESIYGGSYEFTSYMNLNCSYGTIQISSAYFGRTVDGTGNTKWGRPPARAEMQPAWARRKFAVSERTIGPNRARASATGASLYPMSTV